MSIRIETERLVLREFTKEDLPSLVEIGNQKHIVFWTPDWKNCQEWIDDWFVGIQKGYAINNPMEKFILLAVALKDTNEVVGQINIGREYEEYLPGELSIGYFISEKCIGKGYATEAGKAMVWWVFEQKKQDMMIAVVRPENKASRRVIEKLGFMGVEFWKMAICLKTIKSL